MSPWSNCKKPSLGQQSTSKKHLTSTNCKPEPTIWSHDTGQQIPCFDRCQLIITWMSNIKEVHSKPRLQVSVYLEYGRHVARLRHLRHRVYMYAPMSNTASHDNHEKINSWVSFCFPYEYGAPLGSLSGRQGSAINQNEYWIWRVQTADSTDRICTFNHIRRYVFLNFIP